MYKEKEFFECEFCGCRTNANLRMCCAKGNAADKARSEEQKLRSPNRGPKKFGTKRPEPIKKASWRDDL